MTTATYTVDFLLKGLIPTGAHWQLIIHRTYLTPVSNGCNGPVLSQRIFNAATAYAHVKRL